MDVYKVGVSMMLRNGVSAGLRLIRHDLGGVMKALDKANASTKDFGRAMTVAGAAGVAAGVGILDVYEKIVKAGSKVVNQQAAMAAIGVRHGQILKNTGAAWGAATSVSNVSVGGAMHTELMLRTLLGSSAKARQALSPVERARVALDTLLGGHEGKSLGQALKAVDIVGGENKGKHISVKALLKNLPYIEQAMLLTHGLVTGSQILRMAQQAGPGATVTSFRSLLANYTEAVMALGPAVGRGLFTSYMVANVGRAPAVSAEYLAKYGMVPAGDLHKVRGSSTFLFNPKNLLGHAYLAKHGFLDWVRKIVMPHLRAEGITSTQGMLSALTGMFSASTAARLLAFIAHNGPQIARFKHLFADGIANGHPYQSVVSGNWSLAVKNFSTAWANLVTALGVPAVKSAVSALNAVTAGVQRMTAWLSKHPMIAKHVDQFLLAFGAGLVTFGTVIASAGIAALLGPTGILVGFAGAMSVVGGVMAGMNWKSLSDHVANGIHAVGNAIEWLLHPLKDVMHFLFGGTHGRAAAHNVLLPNLRNPYAHPSLGGGVVGLGGFDIPLPPAASGRFPHGRQVVDIGNWHEGQKAIKHGLAGSLNANQPGTTGFNGRVSAFGTPAYVGP